ncbi:MAG TPA: hypothetical protein DD377_02330 [Firmicutes bacterium]|nr:hypothetical protein [Bacillota bacterium]
MFYPQSSFLQSMLRKNCKKEYFPRKFEELTKEYCIRRNKLGQFSFLATDMDRLILKVCQAEQQLIENLI